jgi:hypothetical protein
MYSWWEEHHTFTLEGLVVSANGLPAKDAVVTLNAGIFSRSTVATDGRFAFDKVRLDIEADTKVTITAALKKNSGMARVDLNAGRAQFLQIKLSPSDDRVRIRYFRLTGSMIDFLIRGDVDPRWEQGLSGHPFIVKNETFTYLTRLIDNFSAPFQETYFYLGPTYEFPFEDVAQKYKGKPLFLGGARDRHWTWGPSVQDVRSLENALSSWNLELYPPLRAETPVRAGNRELPVDPERFYFWRFVKAEDFIIDQQNPVFRLHAFLTREYLPSDYAVVYFRYQSCGPTTLEGIVPRDITLLVAAFENVGKEPVRIGTVAAKTQSTVVGLRDIDAANRLLRSQQPETRSVFPPEILAPGERIVFPLELSAEYGKSTLEFLPPRRASGEVASELHDVNEIYMPIPHDLISVSRSAFLDLIDKPRPAITASYVFGPSSEIESIEVDGATMPFRHYDPKNVVIQSGSAQGSCPYVFTYSSVDREWISEGHVLYGVNAREKESTDTIRLHRFDGRISIRESEPEISYIDSVSVLAQCADGSKQLLFPRNEILRRNDRNYVILKRGDELNVTFDVPATGLCSGTYTLSTRGFYLPK